MTLYAVRLEGSPVASRVETAAALRTAYEE